MQVLQTQRRERAMILHYLGLVIASVTLGGGAIWEVAADASDTHVSEPADDVAEEHDDELTLKALEASPGDLGVAYLVNQRLVEMTEIATGGIQIHTPEGTINENTAKRMRAEFERKIEIYRKAILQRGFQDFAGEYSVVSAAPSCGKSGSMWLKGALEKIFDSYTVSQEGFTLSLAVTLALEPETIDDIGPFELNGAAVEKTMVLEDPLNSDYFLEGQISDGQIEIRPRPDVLDSWPKWAGPPKKRDLEACKVLLQRKTSD